MERMKITAVSAGNVFDNTFKTVYKYTLHCTAVDYNVLHYTTADTPHRIIPQAHNTSTEHHTSHSTPHHTTGTPHYSTPHNITGSQNHSTPQVHHTPHYIAPHYTYCHTLRFSRDC